MNTAKKLLTYDVQYNSFQSLYVLLLWFKTLVESLKDIFK